MSKKSKRIAAAAAMLSGLAGVPGIAAAALTAAGPVNTGIGFPMWYQDANGLQVEPCLSKTVIPANPAAGIGGGPACILLADPFFNPALPIVFPANFPAATMFFASADARIDSGALRLRYRASLQGGFAVNNEPIPGDQQAFARIRIIVDTPVAGTYTVTHPFGTRVFAGAAAGAKGIDETIDIGVGVPGDFNAALGGAVGPFLSRAAGPITVLDPATGALERFIGDPNADQLATGSPLVDAAGLPQNYVRIEGPAGSGIDLRTDLFAISGKVFAGTPPADVAITRAVYGRTAAGATTLDVFAASTTPGATVTFRNTVANVVAPATETATASDGLGNYFGRDAAPAGIPPFVVVTATPPPVPPGVLTATPNAIASRLTDLVTIGRAEYDVAARTLTIEASSSDALVPPTFRTAAYPGVWVPIPGTTSQRLVVANVVAPPVAVGVLSSAGGFASEAVSALATPNAAPIAAADSAAGTSGLPVAINVLANDSDPDANVPLAVANLGQPLHGSTVLNPDQSVTYTSAPGFVGVDTFTYQARDARGALSAPATVTVTVAPPPNQAPVAVADAVTMTFGGAGTINVLANDTDIDGPLPLTVAAITQPVTGGSVVNNGSNVTFTPSAGFSGTATFTYQAADGLGALSAPAAVSVTVNQPPLAVADGSPAAPIVTTPFNTPVTIDVLANDSDVDGPFPLTIAGLTQPLKGGNVVTNGSTVTFTPPPGFSGLTTFAYRVRDGLGALSNYAPVTLQVAAAVNAPPVAVNDGIVTAAGTPVVIDVLANDSDADGPFPLTVGTVTQPAVGGRVLNNGSNLTFQPAGGFSGTTSFSYRARDAAGALSAPATVSVTVTPAVVNQLPVAVDDGSIAAPAAITAVGTPVTIDVLANDTDPDGNLPLTVGTVVQPLKGGVVVNNGNNVTFTPPPGFVGTTTFAYQVRDGLGALSARTAKVTVRVQ